MNFSRSLIKLLNDEAADLPASAEHQHSRLLQCCHAAYSSDLSFSKALAAVRGITSVLRPDDGLSCAELSQLHKHFPDVFTGEELEEGSGGPFNSNFNCLSVRNVAIAYPSVHLLDEFRLATEVIGDKETLQKKPLLNCHQQVRKSTHSLVVARGHPAQRKPCERLRRCQGRVQVVSSNIVEICIDAAGRELGKSL